MPRRILVLDDEEYIRANISIYLEDEGYEVKAAGSAEEALQLLDVFPVDIGIIDIRLPNRDGNKFISLALARIPTMRFIIHTGSTEYVLPQCLVDRGLSSENVLHKPLANMDILKSCIESF